MGCKQLLERVHLVFAFIFHYYMLRGQNFKVLQRQKYGLWFDHFWFPFGRVESLMTIS